MTIKVCDKCTQPKEVGLAKFSYSGTIFEGEICQECAKQVAFDVLPVFGMKLKEKQ